MSLARYSAIQHLAAALFLEPTDVMTILVVPDVTIPTLYCDASRNAGNRHTIVAGAIASVQDWKDFDAMGAGA
jgi:hypothetical protein